MLLSQTPEAMDSSVPRMENGEKNNLKNPAPKFSVPGTAGQHREAVTELSGMNSLQ